MTPDEIKKAKAANRAAQKQKAENVLGYMHPNMIKEYQHVFLDDTRGRLVLRDILGKCGVFDPNLAVEDLSVRNFGTNLMLTVAGAHITPEKLESLYGKFVNALVEYERETTPTEETK